VIREPPRSIDSRKRLKIHLAGPRLMTLYRIEFIAIGFAGTRGEDFECRVYRAKVHMIGAADRGGFILTPLRGRTRADVGAALRRSA
jgi:hypothetical protein